MYLIVDLEESPADATLQFNVFLVNVQTGDHTHESRTLWFWFKNWVPINERASIAQEFFKELVSPQQFPRGIFKHLSLCK